MTIEEGIRELEQLSKAIDPTLDAALGDVLDAGLDFARQQSSGDLSYADMRKQDYPYAKRHGTARQPAGVVNKHTGQFYDAWDADKPGRALNNDSEHGDFLRAKKRGKGTMLDRPIEDEVEDFMKGRAKPMISYRLLRVIQ